MGIKRYESDSDNTITNAYKTDLTTRATGSNMGQSDVLEVFSIYAQQSTASAEYARTLIKFPTSEISTDRSAGNIPAFGGVSFFLKLYNAEHSFTLPRDFTISVHGVSGSWQEGHGLDMDNYTDSTFQRTGSNWINANDSYSAATATVTVLDGDESNGMTEKEHIILTSTDGTTKRYVITNAASDGSTDTGTLLSDSENTDTGTGSAGSAEDGGVAVSINLSSATMNDYLEQLKAAIEHANGHNGKITVSSVPAEATGNQSITLTQASVGRAGNTRITTNISQIKEGVSYDFSGGDGKWATRGGDYYVDSSSSFNQTFTIGTEDLELDVTTLVEQWLDTSGNTYGSKDNHGFLIKLSSSQEALSSSYNATGAVKSYYTKRFFGRGTEFFFHKPCLEARWDSSRRDHRGNFYFSSSLAPAADNLNTIYLYNYVRGKLTNIPSIGTNAIHVSLFSGSSDDTAPSGKGLTLAGDGTHVRENHYSVATGSHVSTGVYKCSFALTGTSDLKTIYDVWFKGDDSEPSASSGTTQFHTGAIKPLTLAASNINPNGKYVVSMPNLKPSYSNKETERFRLYVRNKNWSPSIHTVASQRTPASLLIESASYQITRITDQKVVIPYGTASGDNNYSMLSYDVSGNYFDLDMTMLEAGYSYGFQFSFYEDSVSSYREQPYLFKFRVEKDEY